MWKYAKYIEIDDFCQAQPSSSYSWLSLSLEGGWKKEARRKEFRRKELRKELILSSTKTWLC